jgi:hypothetical protein
MAQSGAKVASFAQEIAIVLSQTPSPQKSALSKTNVSSASAPPR